ncbi:MAG: tRNA pseudouridine(55) synthase TruB [Evtepia gabavorous]
MTDHQTARRLAALDQVLILTHRRPDGDTIGCASALCLALRQLGKTAWVLPNEDAHGLFTPYLEGVLAPAGFLPQHVVAVDVASLGMLPDSAGAYKDRIDLVIDHHGSNEGYGRETCVDPSCAACGELLYRIFQAMAISFTPEIAMLLYMAIATDTGCFVYSNTTPETHRIAAALMAVGFDAQWVNRRHFRVKSLKRMQLEGRLVQEMELAQGGTLAFAYVTLALIADLQATEEDLEDISSFIGQVEGVDNAVTIRQLSPQECKISLRTGGKTLNASAVCALHGGGHPPPLDAPFGGPPPRPKQPCWPPLSRCSMANGILIIDKPAGWTSHDVVAKLRGLLRERRIGHAGTLDPMATGVLPVFVGRATRAVEFAAEREKEYLAGLRLGVVTDTQDTTGTVLETHPVCADRPQVEAVLARFRGEITQIPPMYSAIKREGKKLYELARRGQEVERQPRPITIEALDLLDQVSPTEYTLRVRCSKGTYVRTLCHDIGQALGCGGALFSLRRTQSAGFSLDQAVTMDQVSAHPAPQQLLLSVDRYFSRYPALTLRHGTAEKKLRNGNRLTLEGQDGVYRVYSRGGDFLALSRLEQGALTTIKSFFEV